MARKARGRSMIFAYRPEIRMFFSCRPILASDAGTGAWPAQVGGRWPSLNYLVHDAGVVLGRRELTAEGIEANFAINYLSRFVLTRQLLPLLAAGSREDHAARIVIVSGAAQGG